MAINMTFQDFVTPVPADWLNNVNTVVNTTVPGLQTQVTNVEAEIAALSGSLPVSVKTYGAIGNGVHDDTSAIQTAITASITAKVSLYFPGGTYKITSPLSFTSGPLLLRGEGIGATILKASGNFSAITTFGTNAAQIEFQQMTFDTSGTTTRCVTFPQGNQTNVVFDTCSFIGDLTGPLVYSQAAGYCTWDNCTWSCNAAGTIALNIDGYNQNITVNNGHAGGIGSGILISNTTNNATFGVQGFKAIGFTSICTGAFGCEIGGLGTFANFLTDCIFDQSHTNALILGGGAAFTQVLGGYYGLFPASTGTPILITSDAGTGNTIESTQIVGGNNNISVLASNTSRVSGLVIRNNVLLSANTVSINLDSVLECQITGNTDLGSPTNGSWATTATFGNGLYNFGGNSWASSSPANIHIGSSYHTNPDRGITFSNKGLVNSPVGTSVTFPHGCVVAPNNVQLTANVPLTTLFWTVSGGNITATYSPSSAAVITWTAEYFI